MRVVAVSMVRNEADLIESFVRHHCALFDRLLVVDHGSTDRTREILDALRHEGLPLDLAESRVLANLQSQVLTRAMRELVRATCADHAFALDADEFLRTDRRGLESALAVLPPDGAASMRWLTYVPGITDERNPLQRLRWRVPEHADRHGKVAVGGALAARDDWVLAPGNHAAFSVAGGRLSELPTRPLDGVRLAHLPFRTVEQLVVKVVQGWLGTRLQHGTGAAADIINAHWRRLFEHYLAGGRFAADDLRRITLTTYVGPDDVDGVLQQLVEDPLPAPPLRHTRDETPDAARALAQWAHRLVEQVTTGPAAGAPVQIRSSA